MPNRRPVSVSLLLLSQDLPSNSDKKSPCSNLPPASHPPSSKKHDRPNFPADFSARLSYAEPDICHLSSALFKLDHVRRRKTRLPSRQARLVLLYLTQGIVQYSIDLGNLFLWIDRDGLKRLVSTN